eukprot:5425851-Pyramimonas_sp.AAC.1
MFRCRRKCGPREYAKACLRPIRDPSTTLEHAAASKNTSPAGRGCPDAKSASPGKFIQQAMPITDLAMHPSQGFS